jgi:hypothetical protein
MQIQAKAPNNYNSDYNDDDTNNYYKRQINPRKPKSEGIPSVIKKQIEKDIKALG